MTGTSELPTVRQLSTPQARALAGLAAIFDDLHTVLRCCERLIEELSGAQEGQDDLALESLWTTAVLSYTRCFADTDTGTALTEQDVTSTELQGEVLGWHKILLQLREHYAGSANNPREQFTVGATQDSDGRPHGIAITSTPQPSPDDVTVRQTGALAYELSKVVDQRITAQQEQVLVEANGMSTGDLHQLPLIELAEPATADGGTGS